MINTQLISQSLLGIGQQLQAANMISSAANSQSNNILSGGLRDPNVVMEAARQQAQTITSGGQIAAQGAEMTAAGIRQSAGSVFQANQFNLQVDNLNVQRRLKAVSRQSQRLIGTQIAGFAASGLSVTSKSFLQLRNESLDTFDQQLLNIKVDAQNSRRAKIFETQSQLINLENQAKASDYRAKAERVMASNKAAETLYQGEIARYQVQINNANVQNRASEARFQGEIAEFQAQQQVTRAIPTLLGQLFQE